MFSDLKSLKDNMIKNGWLITPLAFDYNNISYIVLIILYDKDEIKPPFAGVKVKLMKSHDISQNFLIHINVNGVILKDKNEIKKLKTFLEINSTFGGNNFLSYFKLSLGKIIPSKIPLNRTLKEEKAMLHHLGTRKDAEDPNKIYCNKIKRNGKNSDGSLKKRSTYNSQVSLIRRPMLYHMISFDKNLSLCYYADPKKEKTNEEILKNWEKENENRK